MKPDSICVKCNSPQLVPKYVKHHEVEAFRAGKPVTFVTRLGRGVVRLIVCDDCKATQPDES